MNARMLSRNLQRKRYWGDNSSKRWAKSLYRMIWGSQRGVYAGATHLIDRVHS